MWNSMQVPLSLAIAIAIALPTTARAQAATPSPARTDVPVQSIMLFSSGVGYFEHAGRVRGDIATELRFKTSQINDILKSLVIRDQDGGRVSAITYPSQDPIAKTLRSFQVDITRNPSLSELLNQLRGARVSLQASGAQIAGVILGVEMRRVPTPDGNAHETQVLNVLTGATLRSVAVSSINNLTLEDTTLQEELTKALSALTQSRDQDKKPVTINFLGNGDRRVRIGYVVETPIWKTSYRLMLDDKVNTLQGWAIVENQTESDWNNVSLSLVSGRPMSFVMDLYQPLYATRPTVTQNLFAGLRPQVYDAGLATDRQRVSMGEAAAASPPSPPSPVGRVGGMALSAVTVQSAAMSASRLTANELPLMQAIANARRMGELFQYAIPNVTLARQKSAMLPIVADTVSIERVSIFNQQVLETHPLNGVRLRNTSGKHLLEGPVTVLDKGGYAGDARVNNVPPGQERLLSFGIDLDVVVSMKEASEHSSIAMVRIVNGVVHVGHKMLASQEYAIDNKAARDKTIIIEHPFDSEQKLVNTQKPIETTSEFYRFQGSAHAGKITTLKVTEERQVSTTMALLTTDAPQLIAFAKGAEVPEGVRAAIIKTASLKSDMTATDKLIAERTKQVADITLEQNRIRDNMRTVERNTAYYQRLLEKLNEQESSIETLQRERAELQAKREAQRIALEEYVKGLNLN